MREFLYVPDARLRSSLVHFPEIEIIPADADFTLRAAGITPALGCHASRRLPCACRQELGKTREKIGETLDKRAG
jgi:hypothetical protein